MYYRSTPQAAPEGDVVVGAPLTVAQADGNIKGLSDRLVTVEGEVEAGWTGLDITAPFSITGNNLYAKLSNGQTYGPYPIPTVSWNLTNSPTGNWKPNNQYYSFDVFNEGSTLYLVQYAHISAATFDPSANDGKGHQYYAVVLSMPGSTVLPPGGTTEQVLMKNSATDYDVEWGTVLPTGGAVGQSLIKASTNDFDIEWDYSVPPGGAVGQFLTKRSTIDFDVAWTTTPPTGVTIGTTVIPGGGSTTALTGLTSLDFYSNGTIDINNDTFLGRAAPATWRFGQGDAASPIGQTLAVQDVANGTTDGVGADFAITGSLGTGMGNGGAIVFYTALPAIASGTSQNNLVEAGRIDGVTGASRWQREYRQSETADYAIQATDGGTQFDNAGASGPVNFTLPTPVPGLICGFCVVEAFDLTVTAPSGCVVAIGSSISATGGNATNNAPYCYLTLEAVSATAWAAKSATGTWTVT